MKVSPDTPEPSPPNGPLTCPSCGNHLGTMEKEKAILSRYAVRLSEQDLPTETILLHRLLESVQYHSQFRFVLTLEARPRLLIWILRPESWITVREPPRESTTVFHGATGKAFSDVFQSTSILYFVFDDPSFPEANSELMEQTEAISFHSTAMLDRVVDVFHRSTLSLPLSRRELVLGHYREGYLRH